VFERILPFVSRPSAYIGKEVNAHQKDPNRAKVLFGLVFPETYAIGMSHLGLQILYRLLNDLPHVVCERVFAPLPDMEARLKKEGLPLVSLESKIPLKRFDILGFSLQYELTYTNLLAILELGGIPLLSKERDEGLPLVIAGGPCAMQPEPLADFVDAFLLGEGELRLVEIVNLYKEWKESKGSKDELLRALTHIPGVYVPSFFSMKWGKDGKLKEIVVLKEGYQQVKREVIQDLDDYPLPDKPLVPLSRIVHERLSIEVARGCIRGCRFCQAGYIYRPFRERDPGEIAMLIRRALKNTGYDEVSLLALSVGDCSYLEPLVLHLISVLAKERIALSLPSLRVGTVSQEVLKAIKRVRKTGITIAPEAATERLQKVINKLIPEEEVLETAKMAFKEGWRHIKLYFMVGLPTEREEDVRAIIKLARKVSRLGGHVHVSVSTFVPKAHTPFQWERMVGLEEIEQRHLIFKKELRGAGLQLKWHDPRMSVLEGVFARGDRRLGEVLLKAFKKGARLDGWSEFLNWRAWVEAFEEVGIRMEDYLRERDVGEVLPWSHLKSLVKEEFLLEERKRAREGMLTEACRPGCRKCGCCGQGLSIRLKSEGITFPKAYHVIEGPSPQQARGRIRAKFKKVGPMRFISHLEMVEVFLRAFRRAEIPLVFSGGFHPLPRVVFAQALPVGVESLAEYFDCEVREPVDIETFLKDINRQLPEGLEVMDACLIGMKERGLNELFVEDEFIVLVPRGFPLNLPSEGGVLFIEKKGKLLDLRDYVKKLEVFHTLPLELQDLTELLEDEVKAFVRLRLRKGINVYRVLMALFSIGEEVKLLRVIKVATYPQGDERTTSCTSQNLLREAL